MQFGPFGSAGEQRRLAARFLPPVNVIPGILPVGFAFIRTDEFAAVLTEAHHYRVGIGRPCATYSVSSTPWTQTRIGRPTDGHCGSVLARHGATRTTSPSRVASRLDVSFYASLHKHRDEPRHEQRNDERDRLRAITVGPEVTGHYGGDQQCAPNDVADPLRASQIVRPDHPGEVPFAHSTTR